MITVVDAREFVDGADIAVRRLAATLIGGVLVSYFAGLWQFIDQVASLIGGLYQRPVMAFWDLAELALSIPAAVLVESWRIAGRSVAVLGPFAYPAAVIVTVAGMMLLETILRRLGVI